MMTNNRWPFVRASGCLAGAFLWATLLILTNTVAAADAVALNAPNAASGGENAGQPRLPVITSLDGTWLLATDPRNIGIQESWWRAPQAGAKPAQVPWIIQEAFPGYHGLAWYWRDFTVPAPPDAPGRYLLRFWGVDYQAKVWLNGVFVGEHEGGETPFVLDVTETIQTSATNHLCVRVLNPTHEPIEGIVLNQTPRQARVIPYSAGAAYNCGGITDSVEWMRVPLVRIEDVHAQPDPETGRIRVWATVRNAAPQAGQARLEFSVAPAAGGETVDATRIARELPVGESRVEAELKVDHPRLWDLNDPFLYRVTVRLRSAPWSFLDEHSVRCGFRDFRFADGYFRLNGRRIFLRSSHTCNHFPIGLRLPHDPDLARRDLLDVKVMGFNMIRFIWGGAQRYQLDLCDEIGLLVYQESFASMWIDPSPWLAERFDRSVTELIRRDRNHPSIVIWGLLNEATDNPAFRHAVGMLPLVRALDDTRVVFLNAGRYDGRTTGAGGPFAQVDWWHGSATREPWIVFNPLVTPLETPFGFAWPPRQVCVHPGEKGEYSVARWTAPRAGRARVSVRFEGRPQSPATTDGHVLRNGQPLFAALLNVAGRPNAAAWSGELTVAAGDTLDFAVGYGNGSYGSDTTGLEAKIRLDEETIYDLAADFSKTNNPSGPWSYGTFRPGPSPDASTFARYTESAGVGIVGSIANPGGQTWEDVLVDLHHYPRVPHTADIVRTLRQYQGPHSVFLSEYGIGSAVDLWRVTRHFERLGRDQVEDARFYRDKLNRFLADWDRWKLGELYARPEDFFAESLRKMAGQRTLGLNAIRANAHFVGYSLTGMNDHVSCGEGLTTTFRELKPGTVDALFEGFAPLRLCLFAEPVHSYRGTPIQFEAVLANEDALRPGDYPVRLQVIGPNQRRVSERVVMVRVPPGGGRPEAPLAISIARETMPVAGPTGRYRFLASFERGAAATGGETEFYLTDPADMPAVDREVVLWGEDPDLARWLREHQIKTRPFSAAESGTREVILVGNRPATDPAVGFPVLAQRLVRGSTVIFLNSAVFARGDQPFGWLPLARKGQPAAIRGWLYLKDEWAKAHPIFAGLPAGGLLDYTYYRELIPDAILAGQDPPEEAVAGAIKASQDYASGLLLAVHRVGAGRMVLNTLLIREQLGQHPAAERLLRNLLLYAGRDANQPMTELPADFDAQCQAWGYR